MSRGVPLVGVDFTSRPTRRKPIVLAEGERVGDDVQIRGFVSLGSPAALTAHLAATPCFVGAFDLPFGPPRELAEAMGWPGTLRDFARVYGAMSREALRDAFRTFCAARPPGAKFAHRAVDRVAGSSPSMKWVNPPVAFMMHAGLPALIDAGVWFPAHESCPPGEASRVALEGYPALLAREHLGRASYKSDDPASGQTERRARRAALLRALGRGDTCLGVRLRASTALQRTMIDDARGDTLDAALCLLQAGYAAITPRFGLPPRVDPLEGWIVGVPAAVT